MSEQNFNAADVSQTLSLQCAMEHVNRANVTVKVLKQRPLLLKGNHHLVSFSVT